MKFLDRFLIVLFNIFLVITIIIASALIIASNHKWYLKTFEANNLYHTNVNGEKVATIEYFGGDYFQKAELTYEQTVIIAKHISQYLFNENKTNFSLELDSVEVNGELVDNAACFGDEAISHMADVKRAVNIFFKVLIVTAILLIIIFIYLIIRRNSIRNVLFKYSMFVYLAIVSIISLFLIWCVVDVVTSGELFSLAVFYDELWENMHLLFFPFQPDKISGSFFDDTLTSILSIGFFMDAVAYVLISLISAIILWLLISFVLSKKKKC